MTFTYDNGLVQMPEPPHLFTSAWYEFPISSALAWQSHAPEGIGASDISGVLLATRFESVKTVLHDDQRFSAVGQKYLSQMQSQAHYTKPEPADFQIPQTQQRFLAHMDGSPLRQMRKRLRTPFTAANSKKAVERCRDAIEQSVTMLTQSKKLDLAGWCDDLAVSLISVLIGYEGDIIELSRWCRKRGAVPSKREGKLSAPDAHQLFAEDVMGAGGFYHQYRHDGMSHDAAVEIVSMLASITHESLQWAMTNVLTVLTQRNLWETVNYENSIAMVDEALRLYTPTAALGRLATVDTKIGGTSIRAGELIVCLLHAAQHDSRMFPNHDEFTPGRPHASEVTFGMGPHACLGFPIARPLMGAVAHKIAESACTLRLGENPEPLPEMINSTWIQMPVHLIPSISGENLYAGI